VERARVASTAISLELVCLPEQFKTFTELVGSSKLRFCLLDALVLDPALIGSVQMFENKGAVPLYCHEQTPK
jgi:hypothetical protein